MSNHRLTEESIKEAKASGKRYVWDGSRHGEGSLGVYIGAKGVSYLYRYNYAGSKERRITLGTDSELTLEGARRRITELRLKYQGRTLLPSRKEDRIIEEKREVASKTVDNLFEQYLSECGEVTKYWLEVRRIYGTDVRDVVGSMKLATVTEDDIFAIIERRKHTKGTQHFLFTFLRPFFQWTVDKRFIKVNPMRDLKRPKAPEGRKRILKKHEIVSVWNACGKLGVFGGLFRLLLLTGARRLEVGGMTWKELDLENKIWTLPSHRAKNGEEHTIHLSRQAMAILMPIYERRDKECEYVFTAKKYKQVSGYSTGKKALDKVLGADFQEFNIHDLRRTFVSHMRGECRVPQDVIEHIINHKSGVNKGLVRVYMQHALIDERREAIEKYGEYIESLVTPRANNVVAIGRYAL